MNGAPVEWRWYRWGELAPDTLYAFLKLRSDIFVVEQNCVFSDMDGLDARCEHLCAFDPDGELLSYLRLLPPGVAFPQCSLGRVVTAKAARGRGLSREAMLRGLARLRERYAGQQVCIGGQRYLEGFYASLGFVTTGEPYLEDGIPHVHMLKTL